MDDYRKAPVGPKTMELLSFAERVAREASTVEREDIARLRAAGFSDRAILDAAHVAGFFCYMNRVVQALGADTKPITDGIVTEDARRFSFVTPTGSAVERTR
jgi:uncharacterized peroxidase-related enzyme